MSGRRGAFGRAARLAALAAAIALAPSSAPATEAACAPPPALAGGTRLESAGIVVWYRTVPPAITVGEPFTVEAAVCPAPPPGAAGLAVDAYMPEHRHGMNYRPQVSRTGDGAFVAEGLLFHMPGRWELHFDVDRPGGRERLSADIELE